MSTDPLDLSIMRCFRLGRFQIFVTWQKMLFSYFHIYARVGQWELHAKKIFEIGRKFWPKIEIIVFKGTPPPALSVLEKKIISSVT